MREDFVKENEFFEEPKEIDIYEEIEMSKKRLQSYYENMNHVSGNMIDFYVYQIKAEQAKFGYLLNEVKNDKNSSKNVDF